MRIKRTRWHPEGGERVCAWSTGIARNPLNNADSHKLIDNPRELMRCQRLLRGSIYLCAPTKSARGLRLLNLQNVAGVSFHGRLSNRPA
jgi:hypothetical protein